MVFSIKNSWNVSNISQPERRVTENKWWQGEREKESEGAAGGGGEQICEKPGVSEEAKEDETREREAGKKTKGTNQTAKVEQEA